MENRVIIRESIRGIIEYVLKSGSIDDRFMASNRALEGTIAHQKLQASNIEIYDKYEKEVRMQREFELDNILLILEGRADGIIIENDIVYIEEIKSTYKPLAFINEDYNELHLAQVKFYAYIYSIQNGLEHINIRLSYFNLETEEVKSFDKLFYIEELEEFVFKIINEYKKWILMKVNLISLRNNSISNLNFPFEKYRKGQRELAIHIFNTIKEKEVLFAQAPTGIGKTISTIFPSIKAIGSGKGERIVYLTAKTITRTVAEDAVNKLVEKGLKCRCITITAKEKICFKEKAICNPENCEYAKGYYDRVNNAIFKIINNECILNKDKIEYYAKNEKLCPFELSLDLSIWCDIIICDYNYAFDPSARLKRFFEDDISNNILLIDEGHNLVDRAREMFSAEIHKEKILIVSRLIKGRAPNIYKCLSSINKYLINIRKEGQELEKNSFYNKEQYSDLNKLLKAFLKQCDEYLVKSNNTEGYNEVRDLYFDIRFFINISELYSKEYVTLVELNKNDVRLKLFCVNPSKNLSKIIQKTYSTIIFSATLSPINYYIDLLGGNDKSYRLKLPSPFKKENLEVKVNSLNVRFKRREKNIDKLCNIIYNFKKQVRGNYIIFFPSYSYMKNVYERYIELYSNLNIIIQNEHLTEKDKEEFLNNFSLSKNILAFCVIGGIFSEGIDLPGDKLIGAIIVGVGFPKINIENDIIKDYYKEQGLNYAYIYPGINKVMQAVGRVIRTEEDKGRVLLVDDRYNNIKYKTLLPKEWGL